MRNIPLRISKYAFGGVCFALVALAPLPSVTSVPDASIAEPTPHEVEMLLELNDWLLGGTPSEFRALTRQDIAAAIRSRPQSFDLFRRYHGTEANQRFLSGLPYGDLIYASARRYRVDSILVASVVEAESSFDADARSPDGAVGLMQVMPSTAALYGFDDDPIDPAANLDLGTRYLSSLLSQFGGDLELAVAAYNAGPANVARYQGVPPFPETQRYVERVLATYVGHQQSIWQSSETGDWLLR